MSLKLKALGLSLLAALAVSAVAVFSASAETGGHFTSEVAHTTLEGVQVEKNKLHLPTLEEAFSCSTAIFHGTTTTTTVESVTLTPTYSGCVTDGGFSAVVTHNECNYTFTIGKNSTAENTVHLVCPAGKSIEIHIDPPIVGTCTMTIPPQTPTAGGVVYHTAGSAGKTHDILATLKVKGIHYILHETGFGCAGAGDTLTKSDGELTGTATLKGFDTLKNQVGITATGSEG